MLKSYMLITCLVTLSRLLWKVKKSSAVVAKTKKVSNNNETQRMLRERVRKAERLYISYLCPRVTAEDAD